MRDRNPWGRRYEREEDMGGTDWSGASGRGGIHEGAYGGAWGGQREHSGYSNYAGGGDRDMRDRHWGRDRDRYDRDFSGREMSGRDDWRMGDRELGSRNDMNDDDDRPRNLGGRDYETRHFGGGRGGFSGEGGYGGSTSYGAYQGSFGMGDYGARRGMGYGNIGRGDMGQGMPRGRGEGWGRRMGGSDLGFGYDEHEGHDLEDRGPHYGKGPKGYRRSDDRIREDVCECIARQGHIDASEVEVKVDNGVVTLSGTVGQRHEKRALEQMVERIHGVDDVRNELRLQRTDTSSQRTQHQNGDQNQRSQPPNGRTART